MRRKPGRLVGVEIALLAAGVVLHAEGTVEFHGYALAKEMQELGEARKLTAHGTLYKALDRVESAGLLESRWEDPEVGAAESRPRRRLYRVTAAGATALERERELESEARTIVLRTEAAQG